MRQEELSVVKQDERIMKFYYLPNAITLVRLGLVPVFIVVLKAQDYTVALLVFAVAGLSDGLDGFIAKRFNLVTRLGAILDPLADKVLLVSAYIMLTFLGHLPFWLVLTVGFRDLLIVGGYLVYTSLIGSVAMRPTYLSKFNTFLQITLVVAILVQQAMALPLALLVQILIYGVFITTVSSGVHYVWIWGVKREPDAESDSKPPAN
ncbi:MAG: CDP-alcohol phosphatidyltransferase family protein [Acidiferrobacterales bacterium]